MRPLRRSPIRLLLLFRIFMARFSVPARLNQRVNDFGPDLRLKKNLTLRFLFA